MDLLDLLVLVDLVIQLDQLVLVVLVIQKVHRYHHGQVHLEFQEHLGDPLDLAVLELLYLLQVLAYQ